MKNKPIAKIPCSTCARIKLKLTACWSSSTWKVITLKHFKVQSDKWFSDCCGQEATVKPFHLHGTKSDDKTGFIHLWSNAYKHESQGECKLTSKPQINPLEGIRVQHLLHEKTDWSFSDEFLEISWVIPATRHALELPPLRSTSHVMQRASEKSTFLMLESQNPLIYLKS